MIFQTIDGISFKMKAPFDFSFLTQYGRVFRVFDDQDSGNICFGVEKNGEKLFLKFAGASTAEYDGTPADAVARLKATLPIYENIRQRSLIRYRFAEEVGGGFLMAFDWQEGACMGRMYEDSHREIMALPEEEKLAIFESIAEFLEEIAAQGWLAVDRYDGSILYDRQSCITSICDIDLFRPGPSVNDMGQMWGSPRFISPEECKLGAVLDEVTNVFTLGQMGFSLFTDSDREAAHWPLNAETYRVLQRAISPERDDRYPSIRAFRAAWQKALAT